MQDLRDKPLDRVIQSAMAMKMKDEIHHHYELKKRREILKKGSFWWTALNIGRMCLSYEITCRTDRSVLVKNTEEHFDYECYPIYKSNDN